MQTTFEQSISTSYSHKITKPSVITRFFAWCEAQQHERLLWLAIALAAQGCILTPITGFAVVLAGNSMTLFVATMIAMALALVTNLAAMPTKITIPTFFVSVMVDILIIATTILINLNVINPF